MIASSDDVMIARNLPSSSTRLVMSRTILDAPTTLPVESRTGEIVTDTVIGVPSFRTRTVSKWSTRSRR